MYIGFTGHRPNKLYGYDLTDDRYKKLYETIRETLLKVCYELGDRCEEHKCITGGALGFDTLAFNVIDEIKDDKFFLINNILAIPFKEQDIKWSKECKEKYNKMINIADKVIYVDTIDSYKVNEDIPIGKYHYKKLLNRNKFIGDISDVLIACCTDLKSGTGNCIKYFKKVHPNGKVYLIDPKTYIVNVL